MGMIVFATARKSMETGVMGRPGDGSEADVSTTGQVAVLLAL